MRAIAITLLLCLPLTARASGSDEAQALEDQGRTLLTENRFQPALEKLSAANRIESTPERLLAIAQCHRELAYANVREAARLNPSQPVMKELAQALGDLEAGRAGPSLRERQEMPAAAVVATEGPAAARAEPELVTRAHESPRIRLVAATGIGTLVLLAASGAAYLHASSMTGGLSDPNYADKASLQGNIRAWQTGSNMLLGAGIFLGAVTAGLFAVRF